MKGETVENLGQHNSRVSLPATGSASGPSELLACLRPLVMAAASSSSSDDGVSQQDPQNSLDGGATILLDVGGYLYKTTISTLKKIPHSYFSAMLSGQYPLVKQQDGSIFIDRDGKHFGSILSFMRSGYLAKPKDRTERKEMLLEAEYYCLKEAITSAWVRFCELRFRALISISNSDPWLHPFPL